MSLSLFLFKTHVTCVRKPRRERVGPNVQTQGDTSTGASGGREEADARRLTRRPTANQEAALWNSQSEGGARRDGL